MHVLLPFFPTSPTSSPTMSDDNSTSLTSEVKDDGSQRYSGGGADEYGSQRYTYSGSGPAIRPATQTHGTNVSGHSAAETGDGSQRYTAWGTGDVAHSDHDAARSRPSQGAGAEGRRLSDAPTSDIMKRIRRLSGTAGTKQRKSSLQQGPSKRWREIKEHFSRVAVTSVWCEFTSPRLEAEYLMYRNSRRAVTRRVRVQALFVAALLFLFNGLAYILLPAPHNHAAVTLGGNHSPAAAAAVKTEATAAILEKGGAQVDLTLLGDTDPLMPVLILCGIIVLGAVSAGFLTGLANEAGQQWIVAIFSVCYIGGAVSLAPATGRTLGNVVDTTWLLGSLCWVTTVAMSMRLLLVVFAVSLVALIIPIIVHPPDPATLIVLIESMVLTVVFCFKLNSHTQHGMRYGFVRRKQLSIHNAQVKMHRAAGRWNCCRRADQGCMLPCQRNRILPSPVDAPRNRNPPNRRDSWRPFVPRVEDAWHLVATEPIDAWRISLDDVAMEGVIQEQNDGYFVMQGGLFRGVTVAVKRFRLWPGQFRQNKRGACFGGSGGGVPSGTLLQELDLRAAVRHPNVCTLIAWGMEYNNFLFLLTEYFDNGFLCDVIEDTHKSLPWSLRLTMLGDAALGLRHLHSFEPMIEHGTFTSGSLLLDDTYRVRVDFMDGVDKQRHRSQAYVAPEMRRNDNVTGARQDAADAFAFGMVAWEICTRQMAVLQTAAQPAQSDGDAPAGASEVGLTSGGSIDNHADQDAEPMAEMSVGSFISMTKMDGAATGPLAAAAAAHQNNNGMGSSGVLDGVGSQSGLFGSDYQCIAGDPMYGSIVMADSNNKARRIPKPLGMLISSCIERDPLLRPTMDEVVEVLDHIYLDFSRSNTRSVEDVFTVAAGEDPQWRPPQMRSGSREKSADTRIEWYFQIRPEEITLADIIGQGAFGVVYKGMFRQTEVAVKVFKEDDALVTNGKGKGPKKKQRLAIHRFQDEASAIGRLRHPNVMQFLGACIRKNLLAIVSTYYPRGSLSHALHSGPKRRAAEDGTEPVALKWRYCLNAALGTARGLTYLHNFQPCMIHRDLKPANILLTDHFDGIVADFGFSGFKETIEGSQRVGTMPYLAPEVITGRDSEISEAVDLYSFGIVCSELATHSRPYAGWLAKQEARTPKVPKSARGGARENLWTKLTVNVAVNKLRPSLEPKMDPNDPWHAWVSVALALLAKACWAHEPEERPNATNITSFLSDIVAYIKKRHDREPDSVPMESDSKWLQSSVAALGKSDDEEDDAVLEAKCVCVGQEIPCSGACVLVRSATVASCLLGLWPVNAENARPRAMLTSSWEATGSDISSLELASAELQRSVEKGSAESSGSVKAVNESDGVPSTSTELDPNAVLSSAPLDGQVTKGTEGSGGAHFVVGNATTGSTTTTVNAVDSSTTAGSTTQSTAAPVSPAQAPTAENIEALMIAFQTEFTPDQSCFVVVGIYIARCNGSSTGLYPQRKEWRALVFSALLLSYEALHDTSIDSMLPDTLQGLVEKMFPEELRLLAADNIRRNLPLDPHNLASQFLEDKRALLLRSMNNQVRVGVKMYSNFIQEFSVCHSLPPPDMRQALYVQQRSEDWLADRCNQQRQKQSSRRLGSGRTASWKKRNKNVRAGGGSPGIMVHTELKEDTAAEEKEQVIEIPVNPVRKISEVPYKSSPLREGPYSQLLADLAGDAKAVGAKAEAKSNAEAKSKSKSPQERPKKSRSMLQRLSLSPANAQRRLAAPARKTSNTADVDEKKEQSGNRSPPPVDTSRGKLGLGGATTHDASTDSPVIKAIGLYKKKQYKAKNTSTTFFDVDTSMVLMGPGQTMRDMLG